MSHHLVTLCLFCSARNTFSIPCHIVLFIMCDIDIFFAQTSNLIQYNDYLSTGYFYYVLLYSRCFCQWQFVISKHSIGYKAEKYIFNFLRLKSFLKTFTVIRQYCSIWPMRSQNCHRTSYVQYVCHIYPLNHKQKKKHSERANINHAFIEEHETD